MGMPHRGRLSVLVNVVQKPFEQVLCEFDPSDKEAYVDKEVRECVCVCVCVCVCYLFYRVIYICGKHTSSIYTLHTTHYTIL
jgi:hypothetical protein